MKKKNRSMKKRAAAGPGGLLGQLLRTQVGVADPVLGLKEAFEAATQAFQAGRYANAIEVLEQAQVVQRQAAVHMNLLAVCYAQSHQQDKAESIWRTLLQHPNKPKDVYINLGRLLQLSKRYEESVSLLERAVALDPQGYSAHLNLGVVYQQLRRFEDSEKHTRQAMALAPTQAQAPFNLGKLLQDQYRFVESHAYYRQALALDPRHRGAHGNLVFTQHYLEDFDPVQVKVLAQACAQQLAATTARVELPLASAAPPLKVGVLSADLRTHPVGWFTLNVFKHLDPAQFELYAFHNTRTNPQDAVTAALQPLFKQWVDIDTVSDQEVVEHMRALNLHFLLDLSGFTSGHRIAVVAAKTAHVQVNWLGYFGTTGLQTVDYILGDPYSTPEHETALYTEPVWRLPASRFCMLPPETAPPVNALSALTSPVIVLGSFQELAKINARVLALWQRVLAAIPQAMLRIQSSKIHSSIERAQFEKKLEQAGMDLTRVQLQAGVDRAAYFKAHHSIDFILDTFPYPGGTTTAEALWMGVPTLNLRMPGMLGRQGDVLLSNVGLSDWVVDTEQAFVDKAQAVCSPEGLRELSGIRAALRQRCQDSALFNGPAFAADFSAALQAMWAQHRVASTSAPHTT